MENHTKKAPFAQSLSTEDSGRKSIPADIHPQYIRQRTNHRISANTNPQPIRQLTLDTQKAPRRVNPAGCFLRVEGKLADRLRVCVGGYPMVGALADILRVYVGGNRFPAAVFCRKRLCKWRFFCMIFHALRTNSDETAGFVAVFPAFFCFCP